MKKTKKAMEGNNMAKKANGQGKAVKRGRGRPKKYANHTAQLAVYVPPSVTAALRRFGAHEEAEGRKRPTPSDLVMAALAAYRPLRDFLRSKGLDIFNGE